MARAAGGRGHGHTAHGHVACRGARRAVALCPSAALALGSLRRLRASRSARLRSSHDLTSWSNSRSVFLDSLIMNLRAFVGGCSRLVVPRVTSSAPLRCSLSSRRPAAVQPALRTRLVVMCRSNRRRVGHRPPAHSTSVLTRHFDCVSSTDSCLGGVAVDALTFQALVSGRHSAVGIPIQPHSRMARLSAMSPLSAHMQTCSDMGSADCSTPPPGAGYGGLPVYCALKCAWQAGAGAWRAVLFAATVAWLDPLDTGAVLGPALTLPPLWMCCRMQTYSSRVTMPQ